MVLEFLKSLVMGTNDNSLPGSQLNGDQEYQEAATYDGQDINHQVGGMDNTQDSKTSYIRNTSNTDLSPRKGPVRSQQETRKLDARNKKNRPPNTCLQCGTVNTDLKTQLEVGRDRAKVIKQSGELERRIQRLVHEKEELMANGTIERERVSREQMEAKKQIRDLQGNNQRLEDEFNILKGTLRGVQEKHSRTVKLLDERTADLKGAQTFLTTDDRYAGAQIMKMVEALNVEIFRGAALISEPPEDENAFKVNERRRNAQLTRGDRDYLTQFIGPRLFEHLSTESKIVQVDPIPLQLAVQAILTRWCIFMVNTFYPGPASNDLKEIYRRIWESEPQAVAGRWRAMMAKQAKHLDSNSQKDAVINLILLCLTGSPMANVATQETSSRLDQVVSTILNMSIELRTAIHEGVTTADMEVFGANPNDIYQDAMMNDIYADAGGVRQPDLGREAGHILCAVEMGLKRSVIRRNGDGMMSIQMDITLKAKVAFPSVLFNSA